MQRLSPFKSILPIILPTLFVLLTTTFSCKQASDQSLHNDTAKTAPDSNKTITQSNPDNDCVFDTSTYKFTTEAIKKYDSHLSFTWDDKNKEATVLLTRTDTLKLHIGGCYHFTYSANYSTDSTLFFNDSLLITKTKWLAKSFFSNGFDEKYIRYIDNKYYDLEKSNATLKTLTLQNRDTTVTDHIYDEVLFKYENGRTTISLSCYQD